MPPLLRVLPLAVLHLPLLVIIVKHVLLGRHEWLLHAEMLANKLGKWTDHVLNLICTRCKSKKKKLTLRLVLPLCIVPHLRDLLFTLQRFFESRLTTR